VASANDTVEAANNLLSADAISSAWKNRNEPQAIVPSGEYVDVGLFASEAAARRVMSALVTLGKVDLAEIASPEGPRIALTARADTSRNTDALLQAAWNAGAVDAFVVRDDGN
jgi:rare lipoprotein A